MQKFIHRVHSTSDVVDYVAFNIRSGMRVKLKLETSVLNSYLLDLTLF